MDFLHIDHIKVVAAGGDLDAASQLTCQGDQVAATLTQELIDHIITSSPLPQNRYRIGVTPVIKGVFAAADLDMLVNLIGGSHALNVFTYTQGVTTVSKFDIRLGVYRASDGAIVNWDFTDMQFIQAAELAFKTKSMAYLPFEASGTASTEISIDNS